MYTSEGVLRKAPSGIPEVLDMALVSTSGVGSITAYFGAPSLLCRGR